MTDTPEDAKIKASALKVAIASKETRQSRFWQLTLDVLLGEEGAKDLRLKMMIIGGFLIIFLVGVVIDLLTAGELKKYGIHPREFPMGLIGIFFAPFLHKNFFHLLFNVIPFSVLGMFVMLRKRGIPTFFLLVVVTMLLSGVLVWVLGPSGSNHIGASGLVFSFFGYLLMVGIVRRWLRDIMIGLIVFLMYSGMIWGLFPGEETVSWETHLFASLTGAFFGFVDARMSDRPDLEDAADPEERRRLI